MLCDIKAEPYWTELLSVKKQCIYRVKQADHDGGVEWWGGRGHVHHTRWCLKLIKQTEARAILQLCFPRSNRGANRCAGREKVKETVTPTAPWEMRTVLAGRGRGSPCWSRWARWSDAADRGSEAERWREGRRPERAEARGRVPCYRLAGSSWFQRDSAPLDAFQSPARSRANTHTHTHDSGLSLGLLVFFPVKTVDSASNDAPGRAAGGCRCFCSVDRRLYRPTLDPSVG